MQEIGDVAIASVSRISGETQGSDPVWSPYAGVYHIMSHAPFVRELHDLHSQAVHGACSVLDAGCGPGLVSSHIADSIRGLLVGVDKDPAMVRSAQEKYAGRCNMLFFRTDVESLPFHDSMFGAAVSSNVLYFVDDPEAALHELVRVTAPGGVISVASARPCIDIEVLNNALLEHIVRESIDVGQDALDLFFEANRKLQLKMRNLYEPGAVAGMLLSYGCSGIVRQGTAYLEQDFHVVARR